MLTTTSLSVTASPNFKIEWAIDFVFLCAMNASKMLSTTTRPLISVTSHVDSHALILGCENLWSWFEDNCVKL